jgi:hypothetical protein
VDQIPVSPEAVLKGLRDLEKGKGGRVGPNRFPDVPWPEALEVAPPWEGGDGSAKNQKKRTSTTAAEAGQPA